MKMFREQDFPIKSVKKESFQGLFKVMKEHVLLMASDGGVTPSRRTKSHGGWLGVNIFTPVNISQERFIPVINYSFDMSFISMWRTLWEFEEPGQSSSTSLFGQNLWLSLRRSSDKNSPNTQALLYIITE